MKLTIKMLTIIALLITVISCVTTTPVVLPDKYNLDKDLKAVSQISAVRVSNWDQVDDQSVMFTASGKCYLLILDRPLEEMDTKIGLMGNSSKVMAGTNKIYVGSSSKKKFYTIEKIYELTGFDQAKEIKERFK